MSPPNPPKPPRRLKIPPALRRELAAEIFEQYGEEAAWLQTPSDTALPPPESLSPEETREYLYSWGADLETWLGLKIPPTRWIIQDILPAGGIALISGQSKWAYKTTFAVDLMLAISTNTPFGGQQPKIHGPVWYLLEEGAPVFVQGKMKALLAGRSSTPADLAPGTRISFLSGVKLNDPVWRKKMWASLKKHRPPVIILDNLSYSIAGDENDHANVAEAVSTIQSWQTLGITVIVIAHLKKTLTKKEDPSNQIRGSSAWRDVFDSHIVLRNYTMKTDNYPISFDLISRNFAPFPKREIEWDITTEGDEKRWVSAKMLMRLAE